MFFKFISKGKQNSKCKNNINNGVTNDLNKSKKTCKIALYGKKRGERRGRGETRNRGTLSFSSNNATQDKKGAYGKYL